MAFGNATKGYVKKHSGGGGGGGTSNYNDLSNKPSINGVTLSGNKTSADLGLSGVNIIEYVGDGVRQKIFNIGNHKAVKFLSDTPLGLAETELITRNTTSYITRYLENSNVRESIGTVTHTDTTISLQGNDAGLEYNAEGIPYIIIVFN